MNLRIFDLLLFSFLTIALASTFSCNDSASIETNLVDQDLLDIQVEDDFELTAVTVEEDSVLFFAPSQVFVNKYPFGIYEDPVFGTTTASIVLQTFPSNSVIPDFDGAIVDSVIMELAYSPDEPFYGDTTGTVGLAVFELTEALDAADNFYTNFRAPTELTAIGNFQDVPNFRDSIEVLRYQADTLFTDTFPAHMRIKLNNTYGTDILNADEEILSSITNFSSTFFGLELRPTISNPGLIAFDFNNFAAAQTPSVNGASVIIYYRQLGVPRQFEMIVSQAVSVKFGQYEQDYSGSTVGDFLNNENRGDSLLFVQGMTGANAIVRFDDVDRLRGSLVNGATLEVYGTALNDDDDLRPLPEQLVLRELEDDGDLVYTRDFQASVFASQISIAGGVPEDMGNGIFKYEFDLVSQLQDIIDGDAPLEVYIRNSTKVASMRRVVLFGPGHSTYPMKLNVTYTKL